MTVLVWIAIVAAVAIGSMMLVVRRRSSNGSGTSTADHARRGQSAVEAQAHMNNIREQSGPM